MSADFIRHNALRRLLANVTFLRTRNKCERYSTSSIAWACHCHGFIAALESAGVITLEELFRLDDLVRSAQAHAGSPFPDACNVGPLMPVPTRLEREKQAKEATDNGASTTVDSRVSAPPALTGLRLLCVLDLTDNTPRYIPACGMSALPPRVCLLGKWGPRLPAGLRLRETHATRPAPEVLARYLRHRQPNAACPHGTPEAQAERLQLGRLDPGNIIKPADRDRLYLARRIIRASDTRGATYRKLLKQADGRTLRMVEVFPLYGNRWSIAKAERLTVEHLDTDGVNNHGRA